MAKPRLVDKLKERSPDWMSRGRSAMRARTLAAQNGWPSGKARVKWCPVEKHRVMAVDGDITQQKVDAIVNAANSQLLRGGGVDGAIHNAAGPELQQECRALGGCETGQAKLTRGYRLPAKWVIHTVGPVWQGGGENEEELLASCYRSCLAIAAQKGFKSIAFPAISTGVYEFPFERATEIAVTETKRFLDQDRTLEKVIFVCFGPRAFESYSKHIRRLFG